MIPAHFMCLEQMPLTPNGKLDRKQLPQPTAETTHTHARTTTPTQTLLATLWSTLLDRDAIDAEDDFFALGGHSLLATQLATRIRQAFEVDLSLRTLFEHPVLRSQAQQIEQSQTTHSLPPIQPRDEDTPLPLSFAQQRLWFLDRLEGESATYNIPAALRLTGPVDREALRRTLRQLTQRHDSLRMSFPQREDTATVALLAPYDPLEIVDLSALPEKQRQDESDRLLREHAQQPFDLSHGPLWRVCLINLGQDHHILLLNMHHIISDGWSIQILIREWRTLYQAYVQGVDEPTDLLPPLPIQYPDYAHWQRQWLEGEILQRQQTYWREQLDGLPVLLELPTDRPRPAVQRYRGGRVHRQLPEALTSALKRLGRSQNATLFMTLLSSFQLLLSRYSRQQDIAVGSPIANRHHPHSEEIVGFFVNTLVLRSQIGPDDDFDALLEQTRKTCLDAYAHQDLPFEQLVEELNPSRSQSHTPLFQVMFVLQNTPEETIDLEGLHVESIDHDTPIAKFDLTLNAMETEEGLVCDWEYNADLFDRERIERMAGHFALLLEGIVAHPEQPVSTLPLLTPQEQLQLAEWNATDTTYPSDQTIVDLFEEQVHQTPDQIAVVFEEQSLTYHQLNQRANQLAHHLLERSDTQTLADRLVGICVERSLEMVVGLLGILKAGAAYVPLDPDYPQERLVYMLEDSQVDLLLTQEQLVSTLPQTSAEIVRLDAQWDEIERQTDANPDIQVDPDHLAYVIYTSGSTGQPKGVMIRHGGMYNHMMWMQEAFPFDPQNVILQKTPFSFDASVWEFYLPLITGATLVMALQEAHRDMGLLMGEINHHGVTDLQLVPSLLSVLLEHAEFKECVSLKRVFCGGEELPVALKDKFYATDLSAGLYNLYGPTEATIDTTSHACRATDRLIPIGRPIANTQIHILDAHLQSLPIGVPGELHIGGAGLARGYLHRPDLTTERFIDNPFSDDPDARLYKSGDLACWLPDGTIEYLGRTDHQIKLRGFRIELGEIETRLGQHEAIRESVVILHETETDQHLVAYYTPEDTPDGEATDPTPDPSLLRTWLEETLPDYMIPAHFMRLEQMPLSPNGKLDHKQLPEPGNAGMESGTEHIAPRDTLELQLARIWEDILNIHPLGVRDHFFDLGGHSLLAVQLMARIQREFGQNLPLATLFQHPTIEQLASALHRQTEDLSWSSLVPIQSGDSKPPFFCVPGAGGNAIYLYDLAQQLGTDQPFYALQAVGLDGYAEPHTTIEAMAAHYIECMQTVQARGPYRLGGHSLGGKIAFEMARQLQQQDEKIDLLAIFDTTAPPFVPDGNTDDEAQLFCDVASLYERFSGRDLHVSYDELRDLNWEEKLHYLQGCLQRANLLSADGDIAPLRGHVQIYRANMHLHYTPPQETYPIPITLFKTCEVTPDVDDREQADLFDEACWGWSRYTAEPVDIQEVPGDHITLLAKPHIQVLAEKLKQILDL